MKLNRTVLTLAMGALTAALAIPQTADDLFQKALMKERAEGRYGEAIALYRQVLKQYPKERATGAQALLHIAECLEKQGNADARKTYEQLVRDYPEQRDLVQQAKAHVAALGGAAHAATAGMRSRQLWATGEDTAEGSVSPDGRSLVFPDWSTGDLAVRDLSTGETRKITHKGSWQQSDEFGEVSRFSNSGRQIAYAWFTGKKGEAYELRVMNADGSGVRTIYKPAKPGYVEPLAWSPDDSEVFIADYNQQGLTGALIVPAAGGGARTVVTSEPLNRIAGASYSPNGKWLACSLPAKNDRRQNDIYILAAAGGEPSSVVTHPGQDIWPMWSPDGARLYFISDRAGDFALWQVPMDGARSGGAPELVKSGLGMRQVTGLRFLRDGAFFYSTATGMEDVAVAQLDPASGRVSSPVRISERTPGANRFPAYSYDGRFLAYQTVPPARGDDTVQITIRSVATGEERLITVDRPLKVGPMLRWHPSGKTLLIMASLGANLTGIVTVDAADGKTTIRELPDTRHPSFPVYSPDGKTLYRMYKPWPDGDFSIVADDLATGATRTLYSTPTYLRTVALAPDGSTIAFWADNRKRAELMRMPAAGGEPTSIYSVPSGSVRQGVLEFSPDGRWLYYVAQESAGLDAPNKLMRVSAGGGKPEETGLSTSLLARFSIHPNGDRIAFSSGRRSEEVWVLENFAPGTRTASARKP